MQFSKEKHKNLILLSQSETGLNDIYGQDSCVYLFQISDNQSPPLAQIESNIQMFWMFLSIVILLIAICFSSCKDAHREEVAKITNYF